MMIIGKVIGALLGFLAGRWVGAILGLIAGHYFDKGLAGVRAGKGFGAGSSAEPRPLAEQPFFAAVFTTMGALAKADGRISEQEIAGAERIMAELGLGGEARTEAIALFKRGAAPDFQLEPEIARFLRASAFQPQLKQMLLEYLVVFALADAELHDAELDILQRVATYLGFERRHFLEFLDMLQAQQRFHRQEGRPTPGVDEVAEAYRALGVSSAASDREIKAAYRKLMSQHHPDKLIAQGVPENMIKLATEKAQEIQAAYQIIEKARRA